MEVCVSNVFFGGVGGGLPKLNNIFSLEHAGSSWFPTNFLAPLPLCLDGGVGNDMRHGFGAEHQACVPGVKAAANALDEGMIGVPTKPTVCWKRHEGVMHSCCITVEFLTKDSTVVTTVPSR